MLDNQFPYCEIDFAESQRPNELLATIWSWKTAQNADLIRNRRNTFSREGVDLSEWHTYGCLWEPGSCQWYLDGELLPTGQTWDVDKKVVGTPTPVNTSGQNVTSPAAFEQFDSELAMDVILGTGTGRPFEVDWVQIWQAM